MVDQQHTPEPWPTWDEWPSEKCRASSFGDLSVLVNKRDYNHARRCIAACSSLSPADLAGGVVAKRRMDIAEGALRYIDTMICNEPQSAAVVRKALAALEESKP